MTEDEEKVSLADLYGFMREAAAEYAKSIQPKPIEETLTLYEYDLQSNDLRS